MGVLYIGAHLATALLVSRTLPGFRPALFFASMTGMARSFVGEEEAGTAPLLRMSKAEIVREGQRLGVDYALTVSCYQADAQGRACGRCDSCRLRREGFEAAGVADPTRYQR